MLGDVRLNALEYMKERSMGGKVEWWKKLLTSVAATLKVDDDTKRLLDRLQATLTLETGRRVALQDLMARLVRLGWDRREDLARDSDMPDGSASWDHVARQLAAPFAKEHVSMSDEDLAGYGERFKERA